MGYRALFEVKPGKKVKLSKWDPGFTHKYTNKDESAAEVAADALRLQELQYLLYAEHRRSLLIVLQSMDAGGKDGTIRHVLGAMNPLGTRVHAFKTPTPEEAAHDFLWRIHQRTPATGEVAIFNRSHYEDVLIVRVHGWVPRTVWAKRYGFIRDFEKNLVARETVILKFFLHLSKKEQLQRLKTRLTDPKRQWKVNAGDFEERKHWGKYMKAYEDALEETSRDDAPWFVIPADKKWFRNLAIGKILVETLENMKMRYPPPSPDIARLKRQVK